MSAMSPNTCQRCVRSVTDRRRTATDRGAPFLIPGVQAEKIRQTLHVLYADEVALGQIVGEFPASRLSSHGCHAQRAEDLDRGVHGL